MMQQKFRCMKKLTSSLKAVITSSICMESCSVNAFLLYFSCVPLITKTEIDSQLFLLHLICNSIRVAIHLPSSFNCSTILFTSAVSSTIDGLVRPLALILIVVMRSRDLARELLEQDPFTFHSTF